MRAEQYRRLSRFFRARPKALQALAVCNRVLPLAAYIAYPCALLLLALHRDERFWRVLFVPAVSFIFCSAFRRLVNHPRPYEDPAYSALLPRTKKGQSFPSRHTVASGVIAAALWYLYAPAGMVMALITAAIAAGRVLAGVHHPSDVLAGAGFAGLCGYFGFFVV